MGRTKYKTILSIAFLVNGTALIFFAYCEWYWVQCISRFISGFT